MDFKKILYKLSKFQAEKPIITLLIILSITLIFIGGIPKMRVVASLEEMMPKSTEEVHYFNVLRNDFEGRDTVAITIEVNKDSVVNGINDITNYKAIEYIHGLEKEIKKNSKITSTSSLASYITKLNYNKNGIKEFPSEEEYNKIIKSEQYQEKAKSYINNDKSMTIITAQTSIGTIDKELKNLADRLKLQLENYGHPPSIETYVTGSPIIQQRLGELISKDKKVTFIIAAFFILITLFFIFRSPASAITPLSIIIITALWLNGTMGYFDIPISTLAGSVVSIVMGLGIDYSIHIIHRFKHERREGKLIREAVDMAVSQTGTSVIFTGITTGVAFFAFLFGQMPEMGRFGLLMMTGLSYAMFLSLFGLPAFLVIEEKIRILYLNKTTEEA